MLFPRWAIIALAGVLSGGVIAGCTDSPRARHASSNGPARSAADAGRLFTDVTAEAGLRAFRHETGASGQKWFPETMGSGGGFVDYNGDGWPDILLVGGGTWQEREGKTVPALRLYRNNGAGIFTEVTREAGLDAVHAYGMGVTVADYDNDGDPDIFLTTLHANRLFRNENGVFQDVTAASGLGEADEWSTAALFVDADRDGHLDLFVGNYVEWSPDDDVFCTLNGTDKSYCTPEVFEGTPPRFYRNTGDGTFTERTEAAGFRPAPGKALGAALLDYNRDGWPDLAVANDQERDLLYENQGDGTFAERGVLSGIAFSEEGRPRAGMGIDAGVVDDTGQETLFIGNFSNEMIGTYRHQNNGLFVDRAAVSRVGFPSLLTLTFGLFLFDVDLDTDLDLLAANGHVQEDIEPMRDHIGYRQQPQLFINRGDGRFDLRAPAAGTGNPLAMPIVARGAAYADYDRDGDQDVLVTENGGRAYLWRNNARRSSSQERPYALNIQLEGRESNRDGIGAAVVAAVDGTRMHRMVTTGSSYLSHSDSEVVLGLGSAAQVDTLWVRWPSGRADRFTDVAAGRTIRIEEGQAALHPLAVSATSGSGEAP
jgi:hypothetical protein